MPDLLAAVDIEAFELPSEPSLTVLVCTAEAEAMAGRQALKFLVRP
jgi:hypothetical protein